MNKNEVIQIVKNCIENNKKDHSKIYFFDAFYYNYDIGFIQYLNDIHYDIFNSEKYYIDYKITIDDNKEYELLCYFNNDFERKNPILLFSSIENVKKCIDDYLNQLLNILEG